MLINHIKTLPFNPDLNSRMPTEREHSHYNDLGHDTSKFKHDNKPSMRLKFLDQYMYSFCYHCFIIRVSVGALALYGLYHLIF